MIRRVVRPPVFDRIGYPPPRGFAPGYDPAPLQGAPLYPAGLEARWTIAQGETLGGETPGRVSADTGEFGRVPAPSGQMHVPV